VLVLAFIQIFGGVGLEAMTSPRSSVGFTRESMMSRRFSGV
jgi:hypothetical protein